MFEIEKNVWINVSQIESMRLERGYLLIVFSSGRSSAYNSEKVHSLIAEINAPRKAIDGIKNFADNLDAIFKQEMQSKHVPETALNVEAQIEPKTRTPKTPNA